jgi:hypothetical protein
MQLVSECGDVIYGVIVQESLPNKLVECVYQNPVCTTFLRQRGAIYTVLRLRSGGALADQFLQDFALSLPDSSHEQTILMTVHDDRECASRPYCLSKLKISAGDYDAAIKRLLRRLPAFRDEWLKKNNISPIDSREAR